LAVPYVCEKRCAKTFVKLQNTELDLEKT